MSDDDALRLRWSTTLADTVDPSGETLPADVSYRPAAPAAAFATTRLEVRGVAPAAAPTAGPSSYELAGELGRGGMGVVFRAKQAGLARDVALKRVLGGEDPSSLERFVAEARTTGSLEHPNVVPVHELARTGEGDAFLAMKLVSGVSWKQLLREKKDGLVRHVEILLQVCNALAFAHSKGILHRDVKPENVMVGEFGEVFVMDWGLAVSFEERPGEQLAPHRSTVAGPAGTPAYMAPEQALGEGERLGPWTDVYLLGATLHEVLTGAPPHRGGSLWAVIRAAVASEAPAFPDGVPAELQRICARALARVPEERWPDAASFRDALRGYLEHRESAAIAAAAERTLAACDTTRADPSVYVALAEALSGFRQALTLWAGNEDARAGERRARLLYARTALARGDVGLAESLAAALPADDAEARELRAAAESARVASARSGLEGFRASARLAEASVERIWERLPAEPLGRTAGSVAELCSFVDRLERPRGASEERRLLEARLLRARQGALEAACVAAAERARRGAHVAGPWARPRAVAWTPDGRAVLGGVGHLGVLWELESGRAVRVLEGHSAPIVAAACGGALLTGAEDGRVLCHERDRSVTLVGHAGAVLAVALDGGTVLSASRDGTVRRWERATGALRDAVEHAALLRPELVTACAFAPDGARLLTATRDAKVHLWEVATGTCVRTLEGARAIAACALLGADRLVLGGEDGVVRVVDAETGAVLRMLEGHAGAMSACAPSPDGARVATASWDATIRVFDLASGRATHVLEGHENRVLAAALAPSAPLEVLTAARDGTLRLWDLATGCTARVFRGHADAVGACAFSPDGREILSGSDDGALRAWSRADGALLAEVPASGSPGCAVRSCAHAGERLALGREDGTLEVRDRRGGVLASAKLDAAVTGCAFAPDGSAVLVAAGASLELRDSATGLVVRRFEGHEGAVFACALSPDGTLVLAGGEDRRLRLLDRATGELRRVFEGHEREVFACGFAPEGDPAEVVSVSVDGTVRLWERETGAPLRTVRGTAAAAFLVPGGRDGLSVGADRGVRLWDRVAGRARWRASAAGRWTPCAVSSEGALVGVASAQGAVLLERATGRRVRALEGHGEPATACHFTRDGRVLTAGADRTIRAWRASSGELLGAAALPSALGAPTLLLAAPGDDELLVVAESRAFALLDLASLEVRRTLEADARVFDAAFSPDGRELVLASTDKALEVRDRASGRVVRRLAGHAHRAFACTFSPDGREVLSASEDRTLRLWDRATGQTIHVLLGHESAVTACAFSPDGRHVLSASFDRTLRLWDRASGKTVRLLEGHARGVHACAFTPDGAEVLSAAEDGEVRLWDAGRPGPASALLPGLDGGAAAALERAVANLELLGRPRVDLADVPRLLSDRSARGE